MKDDGGPAFPHESGPYMNVGMTLRDWFAGMAMQGLATKEWYTHSLMTSDAYILADAMIEARNKK